MKRHTANQNPIVLWLAACATLILLSCSGSPAPSSKQQSLSDGSFEDESIEAPTSNSTGVAKKVATPKSAEETAKKTETTPGASNPSEVVVAVPIEVEPEPTSTPTPEPTATPDRSQIETPTPTPTPTPTATPKEEVIVVAQPTVEAPKTWKWWNKGPDGYHNVGQFCQFSGAPGWVMNGDCSGHQNQQCKGGDMNVYGCDLR